MHRSLAHDQLRASITTVLVLALGLCAATAVAQGPRPLPSTEARRLVLDRHQHDRLALPLEPPSGEGLQDRFDVLHYDLAVLIDPERRLIDGTVTIHLRPLVSSLDQIELDLHFPDFAVRWAERLDRPEATLELRRDGDKLRVMFLDLEPGPNDEVVLAINYVGRPREIPGRSPAVTFETNVLDGRPRVHSFAEPDLARGWWPCKDRPDDKATITLHLELPQNVQVVANGILRETRRSRDGFLVWTWTHEHPIATYLVGFSAAMFARWNEPWTWWDERGDERRMTVSYWAWPELGAWAYQDFRDTLPMLDAFSERFGVYPFAGEKYGIVMFGEDGGMEHQTATAIGGSVVALSRGTGAIENLLAHELAHQWWGDDVGIDSFESVWLKEGLATWSEALWWEEGGGLASYLDYMDDIARPLGGGEFAGTVHAPADTFGQAVYFKGAWVMHMLRWLLSGPSLDGHAEPLLELLREFRKLHSGDVVSTSDFVEFFSREASLDGPGEGQPLAAWFFPQWLEREGRPRHAIGSASHAIDEGERWRTDVRIEQRQSEAPYQMPVHVRLHLEDGGVADHVVFTAGRVTDSTWFTPSRVTEAELDPEGWILKERVEAVDIDRDGDGWADWRDGCPDVPDPLQLDENGNGLGDACEPGLDFDGDGRLNEDDCAPADAEAWSLPETDTRLLVEPFGSGVRLLLEHPDPRGQRPYVADVAIGALRSLRSSGNMSQAFCLASDHEGESLETPLSFGSLGTYWVAVASNGCPIAEGPETRRNPCP